jgi:hypothetical protein
MQTKSTVSCWVSWDRDVDSRYDTIQSRIGAGKQSARLVSAYPLSCIILDKVKTADILNKKAVIKYE